MSADLYMTHEGGSLRAIRFSSIRKREAVFIPDSGGAYFFKLSNGECKDAKNWFIEGEALKLAREVARNQGVKIQYAKRIPLRDKVTKLRKKKVPKVDPRQGGFFYE